MSIEVKNGLFLLDFGPDVQCLFGKETERPGGKSPSRLQVLFSPSVPPGPYSIAALLGTAENGYYGAAVYSFVSFGGTAVEQRYMLARDTKRTESVLSELQDIL